MVLTDYIKGNKSTTTVNQNRLDSYSAPGILKIIDNLMVNIYITLFYNVSCLRLNIH